MSRVSLIEAKLNVARRIAGAAQRVRDRSHRRFVANTRFPLRGAARRVGSYGEDRAAQFAVRVKRLIHRKMLRLSPKEPRVIRKAIKLRRAYGAAEGTRRQFVAAGDVRRARLFGIKPKFDGKVGLPAKRNRGNGGFPLAASTGRTG